MTTLCGIKTRVNESNRYLFYPAEKTDHDNLLFTTKNVCFYLSMFQKINIVSIRFRTSIVTCYIFAF